VSSEDRTGARAPSASYCSTEGVAPLHTAPPVPDKILILKNIRSFIAFSCAFGFYIFEKCADMVCKFISHKKII
jgi:hypothetical protein